MLWCSIVWLAVVIGLSGALTMPARGADSPQTRQLRVNGVDLAYLDQGTGTPVVFVHGAFSDLRFWEPQRQAIAQQYRFIAYTYRYHGTAPWPDAGQSYAAATHAADLAAFIRELNAGPVHLVAISYGGLVATLMALDHPALLRSLTLAEPGIGTLLAISPRPRPRLTTGARRWPRWAERSSLEMPCRRPNCSLIG